MNNFIIEDRLYRILVEGQHYCKKQVIYRVELEYITKLQDITLVSQKYNLFLEKPKKME